MSITQHSSVPWEVFTVDDLFSEEELDGWIEYIKTKNQGKLRSFSNDVAFKNGKELNPIISKRWWDTLSPHLPPIYIDHKNITWEFDGVIDYIMFSTVEHEQRFNIHTDTGCVYEPNNDRFSRYTVLTYLNDNFSGGNTRFYDYNFKHQFDIIPKRGRTLLFDISLFHAGMPVESGTKYWIGTEMVCRHKTLYTQTVQA